MTVYDFEMKTIDGKMQKLSEYKDKVLLIVNTASGCGFTPQYEGLEKLYTKYHNSGFEILGFPCNQFGAQEPGSDTEIKQFCSVKYDVSFPLFSKIDVRDEPAHPLYKYLVSQKKFMGFDPKSKMTPVLEKALHENFPAYLEGDSIKWNFTKFLIDKKGNVVERFEPMITPEAIDAHVATLLK